MSLQVASATFIFVRQMLCRRRKWRERRWWQRELYRERFVYSGTSLLADLKCQEFSGRYKKIYSNGTSRFWTTDEFSRSENCEKGYQIPSSYSSSRVNNSNIAILGHRRLVHPSTISFSKFLNKRTDCTRSMSNYCCGTDGKYRGKYCVLYRANRFAHKIDRLEHWNYYN